jgi:hypothetical protein
MPGQSIPPEPPSAGNELPSREPVAVTPSGRFERVVSSLEAAPAGTEQATRPGLAEGATPAGAGEDISPAGVGVGVPSGLPGIPPDPAAASRPPWPRLVAASGSYTPPRLIRWPIVVRIVLFAGGIAAAVTVRASFAHDSKVLLNTIHAT